MRSAKKGYSKDRALKSRLYESDWSLFDAFWGVGLGTRRACEWVGDTAVTSTGGAVMHYRSDGTRENAARFELQSLSYKRDIVWYTLF